MMQSLHVRVLVMRDILPVSFKTYLDVFEINELLRYNTNKQRKIVQTDVGEVIYLRP